jgi:peroxiredoxin/heme-degrading monooxygenase HmoA
MITRMWRGWTETSDADAYERFLRTELFPQVARLPGFVGARILRRRRDGEEEFVTLVTFESLDAVRAFAGDDYETPVIEPEAQRLLSRYEDRALHYEAVDFSPGTTTDFSRLPDGLPVPVDDGAADNLPGSAIPDVALPSPQGGEHSLADAAARLVVVYVYPRTGTPGVPAPDGWDDIPGARGCTPQSCAFRDAQQELACHGASLIGISTQTPEEQAEFAQREHIAYPLLSDHELVLADRMSLPTFEAGGLRLYKRLTFVAEQGRIVKTFYPVFPPDRHADEVLAWLRARAN